MLFTHTLTVPANTVERSPLEEDVLLTHGVITMVEVEFPPGCAGLVRAYVRRSLHQVWPTNPEGQFRTDGRPIRWNDYYEIFDEPFGLVVGAWSEDDSYEHDIIFRFEVTPREIAERGKVMAGVIYKLRQVIGI